MTWLNNHAAKWYEEDIHKLVPRYNKCLNVKVYVYFGFKGASTSKVIGAHNEMMMDDFDGQMIFGDLVGLKLPDISLTGEEKPRKKPHPRKLVPIGDRIQARCMTSAHAITCSTAVINFKGDYVE